MPINILEPLKKILTNPSYEGTIRQSIHQSIPKSMFWNFFFNSKQ